MEKQSTLKISENKLVEALEASTDLSKQIEQLEKQHKKTKHGSYVIQTKIQSRKREREKYINLLRSSFKVV